MQARTGDYALFFRKAAVEITFEGDTYLVIPQGAILALVRDAMAKTSEPDREPSVPVPRSPFPYQDTIRRCGISPTLRCTTSASSRPMRRS